MLITPSRALLRTVLCVLAISALVGVGCAGQTDPADVVVQSGTSGDNASAAIPVEGDGGIGSGGFASVPFFGANDDQCQSATLTNDSDDQAKLDTVLDCFFASYDAGTPVVVDISIPTVEGDAIFHRYAYDGGQVTIIIDDRLDTYGAGKVNARSCSSIARGSFLPEGNDCLEIDHQGFPDAEQ